MEYALLIYGDEKTWSSWTEDEKRAHDGRHKRFAEGAGDAIRGGKELELASGATTLRREGDDFSVTQGPFAETNEVLGGFVLIEAPDLDAAIAIAKQVPENVIEIRPIVPPSS
jgi:hypothetical protein